MSQEDLDLSKNNGALRQLERAKKTGHVGYFIGFTEVDSFESAQYLEEQGFFRKKCRTGFLAGTLEALYPQFELTEKGRKASENYRTETS